MRLEDYYTRSISGADPTVYEELRKARQEEEQQSSVPASWGADKVTISPEARAAAQAEAANKERSGNTENGEQKSDAEGKSATEKFSAYMSGSRSKARGGSPEERIAGLKEKLQGLQGEMRKAASQDPPTAQSQNSVKMLNSQMDSIMSQIAKLEAQLAEEAKG